jgi:hypothetical protein
VAHCCTCFIETVDDVWKIIANKKSKEMNRITNLISSAKKKTKINLNLERKKLVQ